MQFFYRFVACCSFAEVIMSDAIGIDLGTTNSCVAIWANGAPKIVNVWRETTIPSCVGFGEEDIFVGDSAVVQQLQNDEKTIFEAKRIIGKKYKAVEKLGKLWPFNVLNRDGKPMYNVGDKKNEKLMYPEEISAIVLKYLKDTSDI